MLKLNKIQHFLLTGNKAYVNNALTHSLQF